METYRFQVWENGSWEEEVDGTCFSHLHRAIEAFVHRFPRQEFARVVRKDGTVALPLVNGGPPKTLWDHLKDV